MFEYRFQAMSTTVKITISKELFANDLMPIYKKFTRIEELCSRFRPDSELSRLNARIGENVPVSEELFVLLERALHFYKESNGVFNPGVLTSLEDSGYGQSIEYIRGRELSSSTTTISAKNNLSEMPFTLDYNASSVTLQTKIDLGGMAKGWVIDQSAELLSKLGFGFINVGGDIRIFGHLPRLLNIGIEDPFEAEKVISDIAVNTGAVATSTTMKRRWTLNGENKHHLIDPFTAQPSKSTISSATVTSPTALEADVWAKVVLLLGEEPGRELIIKKGIKAVIVTEQRKVWREGMQ